MKRILSLVFALFLLAMPLYAQVANGSLPRGVMTYNTWSGKISVAGETIPTSLLAGNYFDEADMKAFKSSQGMYVGALVMACASGVALGVGAPLYFSFKDSTDPEDKSMAAAGIGCLIAGVVGVAGAFVLNGVAAHKRNAVIDKYNATLVFQPQFKVGATSNGLGVAMVF